MTRAKKISQKDFMLLLSFLNEEGESTLSLVKNQLEEALRLHPRYRKLANNLTDPGTKRTAELFFEELRFKELEPEFEDLFNQGKNLDLERGVFLISKVEFPDITQKDISGSLDKMAADVNRMMSSQPPMPTRPVTAMRKYLFEEQKFRGNEKNYYDPDNIFINKVLKRKVGIPISLSCVYLFIAWRLRLLAHGVGLPGHFIVGHRVPRGVVYIDPFQRGKVLRAKDCEVIVKRLGMPFRHSYLDPVGNLQILARMIINLINIYNDQGQITRARWLARLFQLIG